MSYFVFCGLDSTLTTQHVMFLALCLLASHGENNNQTEARSTNCLCISSHLPWRPVNLDVSVQRQFHFPRVLFTCLMKNWGVPEIIARELLHSGQNFRGIYKSIKNDIFGLENNLYLHYSHKGVIVRVEETISKLQNWHTCKNFRGTLPCNLSKCAVFHT